MLGYAREELVGKTILDIIPPEDAPRLAAVKTALLVPGQVHTSRVDPAAEGRNLSVPVEVSSNILPDGRWQAFVRDITERRRIEDERQVFVSLLENSPDFIGIADPYGKPSTSIRPAVGWSGWRPISRWNSCRSRTATRRSCARSSPT